MGKVGKYFRMKGVHEAMQAYDLDVLTRPRCPWGPLPRSLRTDFANALHLRSSFVRLVYVGSPEIFVSFGCWKKVSM